MVRVLFLIHDLGQGGAEKVLVNLVNNMDRQKFDITVMALFAGGVNEQFLKEHIRYITIFPTTFPFNSHIMKVVSPMMLHRLFIKEKYDIEVSYLEGPSARIISGCQDKETKLVSWIHVEQHSMKKLSMSFRNEQEAIYCYNRFEQTVCVSEYVKKDFCQILGFDKKIDVLYNTVESDEIRELSKEDAPDICVKNDQYRLIAVGTLKESKGYERLLRIVNRLKNLYNIHLYILGVGPLQERLETYIKENNLNKNVTLLGYHTNPYKYVAKCDLFVCSSFAEGFSTAVTESLIVGTPVCTVEVSGMKELLGDKNEYGIIVDNDEEALYQGIKSCIQDPNKLKYYKSQALKRGQNFNTESTVKSVETLFENLVNIN